MTSSFADRIRNEETIPLAWAGSTLEMNYLNFGDALSPVMVALLAGKSIHRVPTRSKSLRMGAVGTIGHGFAEGEVWFWGTGSSNWANPTAPTEQKIPFAIPPNSNFNVSATRGPVSEALLAGPDGHKPHVYGDPVWLLPRFYRPTIQKKWKVGVILHLSELETREYHAVPKQAYRRFDIPTELSEDVHLITTVTPIGVEHIGYKIDEILACERIVSTSLHGMVVAESYGIPCLYFSPGTNGRKLQTLQLDPDSNLDLRIVDLYRGIGKTEISAYVQPRAEATDWRDVMDAIDKAWTPVSIDEDALIEAFPLDRNLLKPGAIWSDPVLQGLKLQHDVAALRRDDRLANAS